MKMTDSYSSHIMHEYKRDKSLSFNAQKYESLRTEIWIQNGYFSGWLPRTSAYLCFGIQKNHSWHNHHSCSLHILNLYFASSLVNGFACSRTKKPKPNKQTNQKKKPKMHLNGFKFVNFSIEQWCLWASGLKIFGFAMWLQLYQKSAGLLFWVFNFLWLYLYVSNLFRAWLGELLFPFHRLEFSESKLTEIKQQLTKETKEIRFF